jgi:hypothetical protein
MKDAKNPSNCSTSLALPPTTLKASIADDGLY